MARAITVNFMGSPLAARWGCAASPRTHSGRRCRRRSMLRIERRSDALRERFRVTHSPEMQEQDPRLLARHVLVNRDDVDTRTAQCAKHSLELRLEHGEVAIHHG